MPFVEEESQESLQRKLADCIRKMLPLDEIRILLAEGAKVDEPVVQGLRPLHYAVWQRHLEAAKLLITRGCDIDALDDCGYSAIHLCAEKGYGELVLFLLNSGADVAPSSPLDATPLRLSIMNRHLDVARLLLEHGADPNRRNFSGTEINLSTDLECLELLLNFGANPDGRNRAGLTPLMRAVRKGQDGLATAILLISYGADVNAKTDIRHDHRSVLHYAVLSGYYETVDLLLKQGADPSGSGFDPQCEAEASPLDLAILKGSVELVKLLLEKGARVNASTPLLGSPLHVACADAIPNRYEILKLLLDTGADPNMKVFNDPADKNSQLRPALVEYLAKNSNLEFGIVHLLIKRCAKVIIKTQFRHPDGVLNSLGNMNKNDKDPIFLLLAAASESFDQCMIRRIKNISDEQKVVLLDLAVKPLTLKKQIRIFMRRFLGPKLMNVVQTLQDLPISLRKFLVFE